MTSTITTKLDLVILDCPDAPALARFYAQILGWHPEGDPDADFVVIAPPEGGISTENPNGRTCLGFQQIPDFVAPTWPGGAHPQQFHLDLSCSGQIEAVEPAVLAAAPRSTNTSRRRTATSRSSSIPPATPSASSA